jgi:hypothetical protein
MVIGDLKRPTPLKRNIIAWRRCSVTKALKFPPGAFFSHDAVKCSLT